uniref:ATP synthase subunit a n=1 Tax=Cheiracanthium triviale TaxID=2653069 RepID=A0A6B9VJ00_9ARAC|nr:ATP synthase F0 subunit 6 [Cheiracanthium insigne]QHO05156.1 ATP synthase F0 subunit 6 [Cheiracanthium triviale]WBK17746.1 ATP synthase F0 subunit 6 [Cheiracanthium insigne]
MSLFSVFDPTSYFMLPLNWMIMLFVLIFFPMKYYLIESGFFLMFKSVFVGVSKVFKDVSMPNYIGLNFVVTMTFLYLVINNLLGLFPFVFTGTAHPVINLGFGVVLWMSFFIMGWTKNFMNSAAHLVPEGAPMMLAPLMVIIESISHLIRPFTLSIRLAANMMAGHLIVGLLSSISTISFLGFSSSLILQNILLVLEFGVAVIQGFVFSILLLLYALEYY